MRLFDKPSVISESIMTFSGGKYPVESIELVYVVSRRSDWDEIKKISEKTKELEEENSRLKRAVQEQIRLTKKSFDDNMTALTEINTKMKEVKEENIRLKQENQRMMQKEANRQKELDAIVKDFREVFPLVKTGGGEHTLIWNASGLWVDCGGNKILQIQGKIKNCNIDFPSPQENKKLEEENKKLKEATLLLSKMAGGLLKMVGNEGGNKT
jgi:DNA repair exonuclease SbcCD ATPase subunit